jgi:hypothetical protein
LARKNGGDGSRCLSLSKAGGKHRFFCPFLGSSFGQAKEEQKKYQANSSGEIAMSEYSRQPGMLLWRIPSNPEK